MPYSTAALRALLVRHGRSLSLYGGLLVVAVWTVLRHISNGVNFDIVGQIGMAQQWSLGQHAGAQIGSTNYLLKMPVYWAVNHLSFLGPHAKLLLLALVFDVLTFIALFILVEKILHLYKVKVRSWFYLGFFWLATISGSVYWLEYANSRNLETAGGLLVIYLALLFMERTSYKRAASLIVCSGVVFFADPLQVFVVGLPMCLYAGLAWLHERTARSFVERIQLAGALAAGYVVSKLLSWLAVTLLPVSFLKIPGSLPSLTYANLSATFHAVTTNTLKVFGADFVKRPYGFNSLRAFLGFITLLGIAALVIRLVMHRTADSKPKGLLLVILFVNYAVYIGSGQALGWETGRYLMMVPLVCLVLVSLYADKLVSWYPRRTIAGWLMVLATCSVLVAGALVKSWPARFDLDRGISDAAAFMQTQNYRYGFTSRQLAIPASYFDGYRHTLLPLICASDHRVHFSDLFFDKAPLGSVHSSALVPIIIPNGGIVSDNSTCSIGDVFAQLGTPASRLAGPDGSTVAIYPSQTLDLHKL